MRRISGISSTRNIVGRDIHLAIRRVRIWKIRPHCLLCSSRKRTSGCGSPPGFGWTEHICDRGASSRSEVFCGVGIAARLLPVALLLLERFLQILPGFIQSALGVVVGLQSLAVLVGGAFPLSGDVENLA